MTGQRSATAAEHLRTIGALLGVWFGLLAAGWGIGDLFSGTPPGWDMSALHWLHDDPHSTSTAAMRDITALGSPLVLDVVFLGSIVWLLGRRRGDDALYLLLCSPGVVALTQAVKSLVARTRPPLVHLTPADGASWPSAHAAESLALYGALLAVALRGRTDRGRWIATLASVLALIGLSRVYLGVHYPSDVIAGWALAGGWLLAVTRVTATAEASRG